QGPIEVDGLPNVQFVHGSPVDEDEYVVTLRDAIEPLLISNAAVTFFGHTHLQGSFSSSNAASDFFRPLYNTVGQSEQSEFPLKSGLRYLVNPGSVGQPRDGARESTAGWLWRRYSRRGRTENRGVEPVSGPSDE